MVTLWEANKRLIPANVASFLAALLMTFVMGGPQVRESGMAVTNEGVTVELLNPTNGLPKGWAWA